MILFIFLSPISTGIINLPLLNRSSISTTGVNWVTIISTSNEVYKWIWLLLRKYSVTFTVTVCTNRSKNMYQQPRILSSFQHKTLTNLVSLGKCVDAEQHARGIIIDNNLSSSPRNSVPVSTLIIARFLKQDKWIELRFYTLNLYSHWKQKRSCI